MARIVIAICTLAREAGLRRLIAGIARQRLVALQESQIAVEVIDNSEDGSAARIVTAAGPGYRFPLGYQNVTERGLAVARNAALDVAAARGATHIVFIDDDEVPSPDWLEELVGALSETDVSAAVGPVLPLFEAPPPLWLPTDAYVTRAQLDGDGRVKAGFTGNCVILCSAINAAQLRFDSRLNETGGEDTAFFRALGGLGHRIAWADGAEVWEHVPPQRMTARWLLARWYRTGLVEARLAGFSKPPSTRIAGNLAMGGLRLAGGAARILSTAATVGWKRADALLASCYTFCRGAGYVAGALGGSHRAYAAPRSGLVRSPRDAR